LLIAALLCGQAPWAAAGALGRKTVRSAPAQTNISLTPHLPLAAPHISPALGLNSLASPSAFKTQALAQPQAVPQAASALPAPAAQPAAKVLETMAQDLAPAQQSAQAKDLEQLQSDSAKAFDHSRSQTAAGTDILASAAPSPARALAKSAPVRDRPVPPAVPAPKRTWLGPADTRALLFLGGASAAGALAAMFPWLWNAAPVHKSLDALAISSIAFGAVLGTGILVPSFLSWLARKIRKQPPTGTGWYSRQGRRAKSGVLAAGLALGAIIGVAPDAFSYPIHEMLRGSRAPKSYLVDRDFNTRLAAQLSRNPVGQALLNELRDRGGVVRMPRFVVKDLPRAHLATYGRYQDWINIPTKALQDRGWSVDGFLQDPTKWDILISEMSDIWVHELEHAVQYRRSLGFPGLFTVSVQYEYEAFLRSHFYAHAAMQSGQRLPLAVVLDYAGWLDDLDRKLAWVDSAYPRNARLDAPYFNDWLADLRASWPKHRGEGYLLVAQQLRERYPNAAEFYEDKARDAAPGPAPQP
jgi:hypothetical protein